MTNHCCTAKLPDAPHVSLSSDRADVVDANVCAGYQPIIHAGVVRQAAEMRAIDASEALRTGARADVMFRFMYVTTHLPTHAYHPHIHSPEAPHSPP